MAKREGGKRSRKHGRMLRKAAFKRYWNPFSKDGVRYQHRLEYKKVLALVSSDQFDDVEMALKHWRKNRKRNNG